MLDTPYPTVLVGFEPTRYPERYHMVLDVHMPDKVHRTYIIVTAQTVRDWKYRMRTET